MKRCDCQTPIVYDCDVCHDNYVYIERSNIMPMFNDYENKIRDYLKTHSIKSTYNKFTKRGVVLERDDNTSLEIVLEVHYQYEELYFSLWYEPIDFSKRFKVKEIVISK